MDPQDLDRHVADILHRLVTGTLELGGEFTDVMAALEKIVGSTLLVCAKDGHQLSILRTLVNNVKANVKTMRVDPEVKDMLDEFARVAEGRKLN